MIDLWYHVSEVGSRRRKKGSRRVANILYNTVNKKTNDNEKREKREGVCLRLLSGAGTCGQDLNISQYYCLGTRRRTLTKNEVRRIGSSSRVATISMANNEQKTFSMWCYGVRHKCLRSCAPTLESGVDYFDYIQYEKKREEPLYVGQQSTNGLHDYY